MLTSTKKTPSLSNLLKDRRLYETAWYYDDHLPPTRMKAISTIFKCAFGSARCYKCVIKKKKEEKNRRRRRRGVVLTIIRIISTSTEKFETIIIDVAGLTHLLMRVPRPSTLIIVKPLSRTGRLNLRSRRAEADERRRI